MNYEKEFHAFYKKYSRVYGNDNRFQNAPQYGMPYYHYVVQPQDKYKEPFIHASRLNNDRLTDKIGYERPERFPYQLFRRSTPNQNNQGMTSGLSMPNMPNVSISQSLPNSPKDMNNNLIKTNSFTINETRPLPKPQLPTYPKSLDELQPEYRLQNTIPRQLTDADFLYYNEYIRQREEEERLKVLQPEHVMDFTSTPQKESNYNPRYAQYERYLPQNNSRNVQFTQPLYPYPYSYSELDYEYINRGLSPIRTKIIDKHALSINPYTDKNTNLGSTQLIDNPILYPLNTYKNQTRRMYTPSQVLGSTGNRVIFDQDKEEVKGYNRI